MPCSTPGSGSPEVNREVFRLAPPLILWWVWVAFAVANVVDFAVQGTSVRFTVVVSAILVTVTGLVYALALRPRVIAEQAGLTIVNPFRDHHVPWAAIQTVDTDEWVRVHYAPAADAGGAVPRQSSAASSSAASSSAASSSAASSSAASSSAASSSAASRAISCWALYISARTKRRGARGTRRSRAGSPLRPSLPTQLAMFAGQAATDPEPGYGQSSRLPEEAKYLASLPPAKAIAVRLDARTGRERARAGRPDTAGQVTTTWAWPPLAAVALPVLALLILILA